LNKKLVVVLACLAVLATLVAADAVLTAVYFNVPSAIGFTVTIPGESATAGPSTADIEFNSTVPTRIKINCTSRDTPFGSQTDVIPCFNYSNTGNRAINITLQFGTALPAGVTVKAGHNNSAYIASCTCINLPYCDGGNDCVEVNDSVAVHVANLSYGTYDEIWLWADFLNVVGGTATNRTLIHTSTAS
jgi:hypothetical protein